MASDGNYIIDTKIDSSELSKDLKKVAAQFDDISDAANDGRKKIDRSLDQVSDAAKETGDEIEKYIGGSFEEIAKANIFSDFAVDALQKIGDVALDVAKDAIEAAADIKAANAQFSQTFQGVEKTARESLNAIADETGITATRMQESYTSIFAFAKTVGTETEDALDISKRAMIVAADSAAYYDKSIEEATETLQSFLKGNYENDAALGIAATETTRNAKANELYAKSFDKLTESQKVDVLLAMVEAGNELSGAMGQAARESDSWSNVTGELSEAWRQFLGLLGSPLIEAATPIIQGLTGALQATVEAFQNSPVEGIITDWDLALQSTTASMDGLGMAVDGSMVAEEMASWELAAQTVASQVQQLRNEYDAAKEAARQSLDTQIGLFDELVIQSETGAETIIANWQSQREAFSQYAANLQAAVNMGLDEALVQQLSDGSTQSMSILNALVNDTDISIDDINAAFQGVSESRDTVAAVMAETQTAMSDKLSEMEQSVQSEWGDMSGIVSTEIANMQSYIDSLTGSTVYVDVITRYIDGGATYSGTTYSGTTGYAAEPTAAYSLPANVPYLATGAVIPPNAPFMAVLGDQKHGTNIEAPLETIKQALSEVMAQQGWDVNVEFRGDLAALARILTPVITKEQRRNTIARGL